MRLPRKKFMYQEIQAEVIGKAIKIKVTYDVGYTKMF